jgi:hypothetical protein
MMDCVYVLDRLGLVPGMSVTRAITEIGNRINESSDQLSEANRIIVSLGSKPAGTFIVADIIAKSLIEQAVLQGDSYNPILATTFANAKVEKIKQTLPYVFVSAEEQTNNSAEQTSRGNGDKKARAYEIFVREKGKTKGEVATIIAKEVDITYANAYYYVSRVFGK